MPTFLVIKSKWDNVVHRKTGGSEAVVNEMFTFATQHKWLLQTTFKFKTLLYITLNIILTPFVYFYLVITAGVPI